MRQKLSEASDACGDKTSVSVRRLFLFKQSFQLFSGGGGILHLHLNLRIEYKIVAKIGFLFFGDIISLRFATFMMCRRIIKTALITTVKVPPTGGTNIAPPWFVRKRNFRPAKDAKQRLHIFLCSMDEGDIIRRFDFEVSFCFAPSASKDFQRLP